MEREIERLISVAKAVGVDLDPLNIILMQTHYGKQKTFDKLACKARGMFACYLPGHIVMDFLPDHHFLLEQGVDVHLISQSPSLLIGFMLCRGSNHCSCRPLLPWMS